MARFIFALIILCITFLNSSCARFGVHPAVTHPVPVNDLTSYSKDPKKVKKVIGQALQLSRKNLTYIFGSANPKTGGMDCSGVIYYLLKRIDDRSIPRDSYDLYLWLEHAGTIHHVTSRDLHSYQFHALKPGDLLFWENTYHTDRKPPITHVMMYLGENKNHVPLIFGSSDGGVYENREMWGVSVFEFILPRPEDRGHFYAYGCIPHYTCTTV